MVVQTMNNIWIVIEQIKEDIALIQDNYVKYDENLSKDEYVFNY